MKDMDRDVVLAELAAVNIKPLKTELSGGGHWRIVWQACPEKAPREICVAATSGDWRSRLNTRAQVRRLLRADNVSLSDVVKKAPKSDLDKALSVPTSRRICSMKSARCAPNSLSSRYWCSSSAAREPHYGGYDAV